MAGYRSKYINIYIWQAVSFLLNFVSMFIVIPMITNIPEIYGIYSICISLNIFMQYADLGFIDAGRKFAAEALSSGDNDKEKKCIGNATYVYSIMCLALLLANGVCIINPNLIISDIANNSEYISIARQLLSILFLTIPMSIVQKFCQMIYSVRLEDYLMQRVMVVGSCIRILSVFYFFTNDKYDIVGYYAFAQFVQFVCLFYILQMTSRKGYGIKSIFLLIKYHEETFSSMKGLAFGGFFASVSWLVYYELDLFYISILLGAKYVALYSIARSIQSFIRSCIGILYFPYVTRFNYSIGHNDMKDLRMVFLNVVRTFAPIIVIPILVIVLFSKPFVLSWVGNDYEESIILLQLLSLCFIINYFLSPAGALVYSLKRVKDILRMAIIQPIIFIIGVLITFNIWGVNTFAIFKLLACLISGVYYLAIVSDVFKLKTKGIINMLNIQSLILPVILCSLICMFVLPYFDGVEKSKGQLFVVIVSMGLIMAISLLVSLLTNKELNELVKNILLSCRKRQSHLNVTE